MARGAVVVTARSLTPRQALKIAISADARNIETWLSMCDMYKLARLPYLAADCAVRFAEARRITRDNDSDDLLLAAERNLIDVADLWKAHRR